MERLGLTSARVIVVSMEIFPILVYLQVGTSMPGWDYPGTEYDSLFFPLRVLVIPAFSEWPHIQILLLAQLSCCGENPFIRFHPLHLCFPKL